MPGFLNRISEILPDYTEMGSSKLLYRIPLDGETTSIYHLTKMSKSSRNICLYVFFGYMSWVLVDNIPRDRIPE